MTFSAEQLNFFKFSTVVLDDFPVALRQVFVSMWDNRVATSPGVPKWDDSVAVRNLLLLKEGGAKKVPTLNKCYKEWDCTALFRATLFAETFAVPDGSGGLSTLDKLYVKPRRISAGTFHHSVVSPTGDQAETYALALDQLHLLRNTLCHQISTQKIDKATYDYYIQLAKDAFTALGQNTSKINEIGKLGEDDFPTTRLQQLEDELKKEKDAAIKFKQIDDHLTKIESLVDDVGSDMKDVKTKVKDVKTQVEDVGSDMKNVKTELTDMKPQLQDIGSEVKEVKTELTDVKTQVEDVGSDVKTELAEVKTQMQDVGSEVKTELTDVKTRVEDVGSDVKAELADVKTQMQDVGSEVKEVKAELTDVKTQMQDVGSEVKTELTDVKTQVKEVGSDVKELNARVDDMKEAIQAGSSEGLLFPDSCMPDKIPYFVGRQEECGAVLDHLTNGDTPLVGIWGPPGFGKTSLAINVAHHLRERKIPVYFTSLRGMKSKDELVSKLLSIFADAKQAFYVSPSHWLIQCLQQLDKTFVLILDNADDLLESGDSKLKDEFLRFTEEILAQCCHIKLFFTTRERLDYLSHKLSIHQERVGVLDKVSSVSLVHNCLAKSISDSDCNCIVNVCGRVPLAMRLMCGIMNEENVSLSELLEELKVSPLVEVLDDESFPDDARLKIIINRSFKRLPDQERDAFVSLAVFPSSFEVQEAKAVLNLKTARPTKKVIHSLTRKSLIDCNDDFESCTIHSLLRSFIDERRTANNAVQTIFNAAQLRFYDYHISSLGIANEKFLTGHSNDAFQVFVRQGESILISLENGAKEDALYRNVVKVLSKTELFFHALLPNEELLVEKMYCTTIGEAKKRQRRDDECNLLAAKSFFCLGGFYVDRQDQSLQAGILDTDSYTAKRLCYLGVHQLLDGKPDDGISSLRASVDRLSSDCDEKVLKVLAYHVLAVYYRKKGDLENASEFQTLCSNECKSALFSPAVLNLFSRDISSVDKETNFHSIKKDMFFFVVVAELLPGLYRELQFGKQTEMERSIMAHHLVGLLKVLFMLFDKGIVRVRVLEACCNALYSLRCFKEAAEGFQVITTELEKTQGSEPKRTAQNYHFRGLALKEIKDDEGASFCLKKSLDIRRQLLQENLDATNGNKMVRDTLDSLEHCLKMQQYLDGATTAHTDDFKATLEEVKSVLIKTINEADHAEIAAKNYNQLACCYFLMDDYNSALESHDQAIEIEKKHGVGDSDNKVSYLMMKGLLLFKMNRNIEAGEKFQSALDARKRLGIEDHADTATIYEGIGLNHLALGEFNEALDACRQCLKLRKKHLGDHILTARSFTVTGYVYLMREEYDTARENFQHAANIAKSLLDDHEVTAFHFQLLATAYLKMGNYRGALDAYQESRNIRVKLLCEHRDTAMSFQLVKSACFEMGNFDKYVFTTHDNKIIRQIIDSIVNCLKTPNNLDGASTGHTDDFKAILEELKSVLQSMEQINDVEHAELATNYNQLGSCFFFMDDNNAALESFEQAIKIREEHVADSVDKVSCLINKGAVYSKMNQMVEAGQAYQSALDLRKLLEIEDHADTASIYDLLGENFFVLEKFDEAVEAFRQSLLLRKKHLGCDTLTAQTHGNKAAVHFQLEEYEAAGKHYQQAADILKSLLGDQDETASMFQKLAITYFQRENYRGALDALQEVKNIKLKLLGEHLDTAMSFERVGNVCLKTDNFEEAIRSFRKALEMRLNLLGDHLDTAKSYQLLGIAQLGKEDFSDALESLNAALRIKLKELGCHSETVETVKLLGCAFQCAALVGSTQPSLSADQKHT